ncbi:MAG: amidohydrolase family protein [Deltaproteobacteria bacterium]|nr:amidohydrolase family protein [Deltaproteobacteria bacterium]
MTKRNALWMALLLLALGGLAALARLSGEAPPTPAGDDGQTRTDAGAEASPQAVVDPSRESLQSLRNNPPRRIDAHTHVAPGDLDAFMKIMEAAGIDGIVNFSGGFPGGGLEQQLEAAARYPHRVAVMMNLDWRSFGRPGWVEAQVAALEQGKALGAAGLKISKALGLGVRHPDGKLLAVDDPLLDPIFEACGRLGLPVAIHTGDPRAFFDAPTPENERYLELQKNPGWSFHGKDFPEWRALREAFLARIGRHPKTTFIGVHFGNSPEDPRWVADVMDQFPNLYIDTAARLPEVLRQEDPVRWRETRRVFDRHTERVLFGSDSMQMGGELILGAPGARKMHRTDAAVFFRTHWRLFQTSDFDVPSPSPIQGKWPLRSLGLKRNHLEPFYHGTAERLFPQLATP